MRIYVVWLFDYWWEQSLPVGVFTTEEKAAQAAQIVIEQKRKENPEEVPDDRYDINIEESMVDGFISNSLLCLYEA